MHLLQAIALGIVQGLTEFFPVSSSGHLVLAQDLLGIDTPGVSFEVLVHLATVAAILVVYRRRIVRLFLEAASGDRHANGYIAKLILASVPVAVIGLAFGDAIAGAFDSPQLVAFNLLATGGIIFSTRWLVTIARRPAPAPTWRGAAGIGVAQAVALLPGISRSGATVAVALADRTERAAAAEFSFLLSIPAILGASALELPAILDHGLGLGATAVIGAASSAFLAAIAAIVLFVRWLRIGRLHFFAYYCWLVGGGYLLYKAIVS